MFKKFIDASILQWSCISCTVYMYIQVGSYVKFSCCLCFIIWNYYQCTWCTNLTVKISWSVDVSKLPQRVNAEAAITAYKYMYTDNVYFSSVVAGFTSGAGWGHSSAMVGWEGDA